MKVSAKIDSINTGLSYGPQHTGKEDELKSGFLYLGFLHGRTTPGESLEDWGSDGPVLGPFTRLIIEDFNKLTLIDEDGKEHSLQVTDSLICVDEIYYGDITVFNKQGEKLPQRTIMGFPIVKYPYDGSEVPGLVPALYIDAQNTFNDQKVLFKRALIGPLYGMHITYLHHISLHSENLSPGGWCDLNTEDTELVDGKFNRLEIFVKQ
jgi:hypothetical protein